MAAIVESSPGAQLAMERGIARKADSLSDGCSSVGRDRIPCCYESFW